MPEGVYERKILPVAPLLHGVKEAFADPDTGMAPTLMEIDSEQVDGFYSVCEARITALMEMEQPDSPAARRRAAEMYRQVEKPFAVYPGMSSNVMDYQNIMGFLVLLFCQDKRKNKFPRNDDWSLRRRNTAVLRSGRPRVLQAHGKLTGVGGGKYPGAGV